MTCAPEGGAWALVQERVFENVTVLNLEFNTEFKTIGRIDLQPLLEK